MTPNTPTFDGLGIAPKLLQILDKLKFTVPTPIQLQSIPTALEGKDIMGIAQTGTGKTLAFGIPMLQKIAGSKIQGLILLPTRELAVQVNESLSNIGRPLGLKTAVLIGGENIGRQTMQLRRQPHIIIATPGRLIDHLEQRTVSLNQVGILVLDEADRMLDMGFAPQIKRVLQNVPKERQTLLFSATMPHEIVEIANSYMKGPVRVEIAPQGTTASQITQELFFVQKDQKLQLLEKLLTEYKGSVLIFSRTKFGAKKIANSVRNMGHTASEIHSNRSLNQRLEALSGFKVGKYRVLVATDIAARGIDVTGISLVLNFDLPEQAADYVHRIGRTGRAAHSGHAISFATPDQKFDVRSIERLMKSQLPVSPIPTLPEKRALHNEPQRSFGNPRFGGNRPNDRGQRSFAPSHTTSVLHGDRGPAKPNPFSSPYGNSSGSRFGRRKKPAPRQRGGSGPSTYGNYRSNQSPRDSRFNSDR